MTKSSKNTLLGSTDTHVDLLPPDELGGISVNPESFARFDALMTSAVRELETRWAHKAAPADTLESLRSGRQRR